VADKSIDIETATFDRFKKDFDDYHKALGGTLNAWKAVAKQINDAKDAVKGLSAMTRSTTTATSALTDQTKSYASAVSAALG
jgi:hypothetical protein